MNVRSYEQPLMQYAEFRAHKFLLLYVPPVLIILGTFGNIFSFLILMGRPMRKFSTYIYLAVLSITDTLVLYMGLLRLWIGELTGFDVRDRADWICKVISVFGYTVSDYSVWLIIAVTVERYIAVCKPLKAPGMCNRSRAIKVIIFLLFLLLTLNAHFFWTAQIKVFKVGSVIIPQCAGASQYEVLVQDVWPWVDAFIYSFLPFVVILVLNAIIIFRVVRARNYRTQMQQSSVLRDNRRAHHESSTKLTVMLLTISFAFLLMTLPMNTSMIAMAFSSSYVNDLRVVSKYKLVRTVTELLMYANHSMNFYLYCATGQKFRGELLRMLCGRGTNTSQERSTTHMETKASTLADQEGTELLQAASRKTVPKCGPPSEYIRINVNGRRTSGDRWL